jgi:hypothetical protein
LEILWIVFAVCLRLQRGVCRYSKRVDERVLRFIAPTREPLNEEAAMRNANLRLSLALVVSGLAAGGAQAQADELQIQHRSVPCVVLEQYPRIEASIEPAADVEAARVVFHSEGATGWYSVPMRREGSAWVAALPRPKGEGSRFAYYISAQSRGSQERFPDAAALIVDVSATCAEGSLPTSEHGPTELGVPVGAPRMAPGFDTHGVSQFVESQALDAAPAPPLTRSGVTAVLSVPLLSPVRITTAEPPLARIGVIRDDERSITMDTHGTGKSVTWTKAGQRLEGRFESYDDDGALILRLSNAARVRVRAEDLTSLEVRQPGSAALGTVGALVGTVGGFVGGAVVWLAVRCHDATPIYVGTALGTVLGATAGAPAWKPVVLGQHTAMGLTVGPRRAGAAVGVQVAF